MVLVVMSPFSSNFIYSDFLILSWLVWLKVCQFCLSFKETSFSFRWSSFSSAVLEFGLRASYSIGRHFLIEPPLLPFLLLVTFHIGSRAFTRAWRTMILFLCFPHSWDGWWTPPHPACWLRLGSHEHFVHAGLELQSSQSLPSE
jgi:hypothetical protein